MSFQKLCQQESNWKLRFVGNISEKTINLIKKYALESFVEIIDYKPHKEAVGLMCSSDVLLLIIPKIKENKGILTGKLFEYIASENPIIFIGPKDGDAAKIVSETNNASIHNYNEELDLLRITKDILNRNIDPKIKLKYSRIEQTKEIANLLKKGK